MFYLTKSPGWLQQLFKGRVWKMGAAEKKIYLTFDDGPHATITPVVLDTLAAFNAKATFFCIGKNVVANPYVYRRILGDGHAVGNHTFDHLNGWQTDDDVYLDNIAMAKQYIDSNLFRPPYGKISSFQQKRLNAPRFRLHTVMWTVLSADFDQEVSKEKCLQHVLLQAGNGSIIVFHDSDKAKDNMLYALPEVLKYFSESGYLFERIVLE